MADAYDVPGFLPSTNAPLFGNGPWPPATRLTVPIPGLPDIRINTSRMGFCGGMAFIARDIAESGRPQLRTRDPRTLPQPVADQILRRLRDSFGGFGTVAHWLRATAEEDRDETTGAGLFADSVRAAEQIIEILDSGRLCPVGLVLTRSLAPWAVFDNHVELAYGYRRQSTAITLRMYDSNNPADDDVTLTIDAEGEPVIRTNGTDNRAAPGTVRGFFPLSSYRFTDPAPLYVDQATLTLRQPAPGVVLSAGASVTAELQALNTGSTTWTPDAGYRLGSQFPQDNRDWGPQRIELDGPVDPGASATFRFLVTAPAAGPSGQVDFGWRMVHDRVTWFGNAVHQVYACR